jgi:RNA recognition motif-containing protein
MGYFKMEMLTSVDINFLLCLGTMLVIFSVFYFIAARKQKGAMAKIDESLKRQNQTNQQLGLILNELRRSTRLLSVLASVESNEESFELTTATAESGYEATEHQHKLYVGNIDYTATESELASHFSRFGQVEFVNIPVNRYTGKARGFGFVTFISREDAERAMALHGTEFKGRQIQVNFAKERESA